MPPPCYGMVVTSMHAEMPRTDHKGLHRTVPCQVSTCGQVKGFNSRVSHVWCVDANVYSILRPETCFWPGALQVAFSTLTAAGQKKHASTAGMHGGRGQLMHTNGYMHQMDQGSTWMQYSEFKQAGP